MIKEQQKEKRYRKKRRHRRVRAKIFGTMIVPRLSVFRSNHHIWCQLVNDEKGQTLVAASDKNLKLKSKKKSSHSKTEVAFEVGKLIAKRAKEKGIEKVIFDRSGYKYHGRVKALAEGAREEGLKF